MAFSSMAPKLEGIDLLMPGSSPRSSVAASSLLLPCLGSLFFSSAPPAPPSSLIVAGLLFLVNNDSLKFFDSYVGKPLRSPVSRFNVISSFTLLMRVTRPLADVISSCWAPFPHSAASAISPTHSGPSGCVFFRSNCDRLARSKALRFASLTSLPLSFAVASSLRVRLLDLRRCAARRREA